jgi:hypothetical protein
MKRQKVPEVYSFLLKMPAETGETIATLAKLQRKQTMRSCTRNDILLELIRRGLASLADELGYREKPCIR